MRSVTTAIVFGDLHYASEPPESRKHTYRAELDSFLSQVARDAATFGASFVACAGDHFHRKGKTPHGDVIALARAYRKIGRSAPLVGIPGNHDMVGHNVETSEESQPFGVLASAGVIGYAHCTPVVYDRSVAVIGVAYSPDSSPATIARQVRARVDATSASFHSALVLLHHDIIGRDQARVVLAAVAKETGVPTVVCNGHIHDAPWHAHFGLNSYVGLGSVARTSTTERANVPSYFSITFEEGERASVAAIPFEGILSVADAFDDDALAAPPAENTDLDTFVELVGGDGDESAFDPAADVRAIAAELKAPDDAVEATIELIRGATHA